VKRRLVVAIPLLSLVVLLAWILRPKHELLGFAYVGEKSVSVWSSVAQVRQSVETVHYGEKVDVLGRRNDNVEVRTPAGVVGWMDNRYLIEPTLWHRSVQLVSRAVGIPVQARGRTKVSTNVRVEPGRSAARLYRFSRGVPVEIVGRGTAEWVQATDEKDSSGEPAETKKEDWFLIRGIASRPAGGSGVRTDTASAGDDSDQPIPIAGWVVARFVELDLPESLREAASSANVRPLAWFELNRVPDPSGDKPQYLLAGARGPEGQPCDFTTLRVFTWNGKRSRYETAFIENDLCGALPVRLEKGPKGEPEFRCSVMDGAKEERVYRLYQTIVRRVREAPKTAAKTAQKSSAEGHAR